MAEMLSPGVFTTEIDASTIAPTVSNSIGVFAGQFEKGPVGDYLLITTVDELIEYYGLPSDENYNDWYQAYNFLQYGNKLYISRAVDGNTAVNAVAEVAVDGGTETTDVELESDVTMIGNADDYETAETSIPFSSDDAKLKFIAKNPGEWGNDIEIAIANPDVFNGECQALAFEGVPLNDLFEYYPTGTQVGIVIRYGNDIKEVFTVDLDPSAKDQNNKSNYIETVINAQSNYVFVKDNTSIVGVPSNYLYQDCSAGVEEEPFAPIRITASDAQHYDGFGCSVALDGTRLVVGALGEDTAANAAGKVYIYDWNGTSYDEVGTLTASDVEEYDQFGASVALDGTRLVVGASGESTIAAGAGKVYIYEWNGTSYVEVATVTASDAQAEDFFGNAVALDGTRLVVGAPGDDTTGSFAGKVYVYDWNGSTYDEVGTLTASDTQEGDAFGVSVALDGTRLVVGAAQEDTAAGYDEGKVYIYEWNGTSYVEVTTLTASDAELDDNFGSSVSLDGTRLVVGAIREDTAGDNAGKVYIYDWNGTSYVEVTTLTASDAESGDMFGSSVAVDGTRLAVGAIGDDTAIYEGGKVYIYYFDGTIYDPIEPQPEDEPLWYCPVPDSNYWFTNDQTSFYASTMYYDIWSPSNIVYPHMDTYNYQIGISTDGNYTNSSFSKFQSGFEPDKIIAVIKPTDNTFQFNGWSDITMTAVSGGGGVTRSVSMTKAELEEQTGQPFNMDHCYRLEIVIDPAFYGEIDWLGHVEFSSTYGQSYLIDLEFYKNDERVYPQFNK